jgi:Co/Zn/Cd efflux system component
MALAVSSSLWAAHAHAHEGHGLFGAHWHATDALGFVVLAVAVAAAIWFTRK